MLAELQKLCAEHLDMDALENSIECNTGLKAHRKALLLDVSASERRVVESTRCVKELYLDKVKGVITESDFLELSKEFSREKAQAEQMLQDAKRRLEEVDERLAAGEDRRAIVERYVSLDHLTREAVDVLIDYIVVGKRAPGTKTAPVEIHWNF